MKESSVGWKIPLFDLGYGPEETDAVTRVLRSGWLSMGPEVELFEEEWADHLGVEHAVAVTNGTAALHLALLALEIGPGATVLQPALNFVAGANMTRLTGARPKFVDVTALDEPLINPDAAERAIDESVKAIMVMHYGGYACNLDRFTQICLDRNIFLIEDACHAPGGRYGPRDSTFFGRGLGTIGEVGCFSFFSNKNIPVGEGGMIVTNRADIADRIRLLRSHGMTSGTWQRHRAGPIGYEVVETGFNYRLDEIRAALGRAQLRKLSHGNGVRADLVSHYRRRLSGLKGWSVPFAGSRGSAFHLMVCVAPSKDIRDATRDALARALIQTSLHYPPITGFPAFREHADEPVPVTCEFAERAITLPLFPGMATSDVDMVCEVIETVAHRTQAVS